MTAQSPIDHPWCAHLVSDILIKNFTCSNSYKVIKMMHFCSGSFNNKNAEVSVVQKLVNFDTDIL